MDESAGMVDDSADEGCVSTDKYVTSAVSMSRARSRQRRSEARVRERLRRVTTAENAWWPKLRSDVNAAALWKDLSPVPPDKESNGLPDDFSCCAALHHLISDPLDTVPSGHLVELRFGSESDSICLKLHARCGAL